MRRRSTYWMVGAGIGLSIRLVILLLKGTHDWTGSMINIGSLSMAIASGVLAVSIAESRGRVMSREELNQPLTLFPGFPPRELPIKRTVPIVPRRDP